MEDKNIMVVYAPYAMRPEDKEPIGFMPFVFDTEAQTEQEENTWSKADLETLKRPFEFSCECDIPEGFDEMLGGKRYDQVFKAIENESGLNISEFIKMMKQVTFGDETVVKFFPRIGRRSIKVVTGRGNGKTPPVICETNIGVFAFIKPFSMASISIDDLCGKDFAEVIVDELIVDELANQLSGCTEMPHIDSVSRESELREKIKFLEKRLKYEKHPLQQKKLRTELGEAKKELKIARRK